MEDEVQLFIDDAKENMEKSVQHLESSLAAIRAGKADPKILNGITVNYYGVETPLNQVSNIGAPDAVTISIQPWEKSMIGPIEKAIMASNIGLTPANNGELIRLNIPPLTEERRKNLVKQVRNEGENAKISVRNTRRDANEEFKKLQKEGLSEDEVKDAEAKIQEFTDHYTKEIDQLVTNKEKDVMTV